MIAGHRAWDISVPFSSVVSVLHNRVGTSLGGLQGRPVLCLRVVDDHGGAVARDRRLRPYERKRKQEPFPFRSFGLRF